MSLERFIIGYERDYEKALAEMRNGRKETKWMWYIFPQIKGLGTSATSEYYGIEDLEEAKAFLRDAYLGARLIEISTVLLRLENNDARWIFGRDSMKLRSCMTLFSLAAPEETVFRQVLEKFFRGVQDYRTLVFLGLESDSDWRAMQENAVQLTDARVFDVEDDNIQNLRAKHPEGLHFVVGDVHGAYTSLRLLMEKIRFDPACDHVYFVGDYNSGGDPMALLYYIARYYQEDHAAPGFHLIRGNHEREMYPYYPLENLPDIFVLRGRTMNYYIAHAGMVKEAFELINADMKTHPDEKIYAYAFHDDVAAEGAPFRQVVWSKYGLYSQRSENHIWPSQSALRAEKACIIHGHTPFCMLKKGNYFSYGDEMLFWRRQRIWFAEDLQSFDIDSNVKGKHNPDYYRGLSCVCLEVLDDIAEHGDGTLQRDVIRNSENFVFSVPYAMSDNVCDTADIYRVLNARPVMKQIGLDENGIAQIVE